MLLRSRRILPSSKQAQSSHKTHGNTTNNSSVPIKSPQTFADLPTEIRIRIYRTAIGDRLIHIGRKSTLTTTSAGVRACGTTHLRHHLCKSQLSEDEFYASRAKPVVFRNRIDEHTRPREEEDPDPHFSCIPRHYLAMPPFLDTQILQVSREARYEGLKLLYGTNMRSFADPWILKKWLGMTDSLEDAPWSQTLMPPWGMVASIRHLRLDLRLDTVSWEQIIVEPRRMEGLWRDILLVLPLHFPNLGSLHLSITLFGYVTCSRLSQGMELTEMFRPLRQLGRLKVFTVVINDRASREYCAQEVHDKETHASAPRHTFFARKEVRTVWAEEIRKLVLDGSACGE